MPAAPEQPADAGPGGRVYRHAGLRASEMGIGADKLFVFEPDGPAPPTAPVVLFLHSELYLHPNFYSGWIRHLVRRGHIVIFPCYQGSDDPQGRWLFSAARALLHALRWLEHDGHVRPQRDQLACIGHGCGAVLACNLAAAAPRFTLPRPRVLMVANPTYGAGTIKEAGLRLRKLDALPDGTLLLVVTGEDDFRQDYELAQRIFYDACNLRSDDRGFVILRSDLRGRPALVADHPAARAEIRPLGERYVESRRAEWVQLARAPGVTARALRGRDRDALDYFGYWKLGDGLLAAAFADDPAVQRQGRLCALGESPAQRFLGVHGDGRPVTPLLSSERP